MKHIKRSVSLLLLVALLTALFAGVTFQASAKNTNKRDTLCTSLSTMAKAYYTGAYTYDKMSALAGGNTDCVASMNSALYKSLQSLMSSTQTDSVSYRSLTKYWPTTDNNILFYADQTGSGYNREHVWPKSRASFYQKNGGCDLHHLRPADQTLNSTRKNYTMGYVNGVINGGSPANYGGRTVLWYSAGNDLVEVRDNVKGDVARILLYVYCRWGQPNLYQNVAEKDLPAFDSDDDANNGKKVIESLDTLLKWCKSDPVDTWEMTRNDEVQNVQSNRNVFIDYPEYAWLVFGQDIPNDMKTPSGEAAHAAPACDHVWDAGKVTTEPTCTEKGIKTYTCKKCSATKTEEINALGHDYVTKRIEPTCTEDGKLEEACSRCGDVKYSRVIPATGHNFRKNAQTGKYVCENCGKVLGESENTKPTKPTTPTKPGKDDTKFPFTDVSKNDRYYDAVDYLYNNGIMNGTTDTLFSPNAELTRAMVVTILYRAQGKPAVSTSGSFKDVAAGRYYTEAVEWAAANNIVKGFTDGTFKPDEPVTREQLAAFLSRYAEYNGIEIVAADGKLDADAVVSNWAKKNVEWAVAEGILTSAQAKNATQNATRAEVAMALYTYLTKVAK